MLFLNFYIMTAFSFKGTGEKLLISLWLALLGAFTTWLATLPELYDFGMYAPLVGAGVAFAVNMLRTYMKP